MIQIKRGSTANWKKLKTPLADGQPGYDKDKHKIKVGDGTKLWDKLPYASITEEEVLDSETNAKARVKEDPESLAIITYGTASPDKNTVGKLYLQHYATEPEVDYVVETGISGIWTYRKWKSGMAECWGHTNLTTAMQNPLEGGSYSGNNYMGSVSYPFSFKNSAPFETVSVQSTSNLVWIAGRTKNTTSKTGTYVLVSPYSCASATYTIMIHVSGYWR